MLKLLLRLWADQKRRDFKWMRFLGEAYLFLLFLIISASVTFVAYTEMGATSGAAVAVPFVAAGLIVPDFLGKLVMKQDETVMDPICSASGTGPSPSVFFLSVCYS